MFLEKRSQTIDSINRSAPITHKPKQVPFHKGSSNKFEEKSYCGLAINAEINSDNLNQQLQAFWEIERVDESSIEHSLEEICATQYQNTHYCTEEGHYVVQLPLKKDPYCLDVVNCRESYTKREVLSIIARLFDPLGFLGSILTKAKLILQKLWVLKLEWDEPLSNSIAKEWNDFVSTLPVIQNIHVPRLVIGKGRIIIHGFADTSTAAYGAVLYTRFV
ncbi:integrase catalytic domain-containing protein [Trichonephila clavipes]|nr:integrase catalytic domain-containing protein [Trichonephila clavipes]